MCSCCLLTLTIPWSDCHDVHITCFIVCYSVLLGYMPLTHTYFECICKDVIWLLKDFSHAENGRVFLKSIFHGTCIVVKMTGDVRIATNPSHFEFIEWWQKRAHCKIADAMTQRRSGETYTAIKTWYDTYVLRYLWKIHIHGLAYYSHIAIIRVPVRVPVSVPTVSCNVKY